MASSVSNECSAVMLPKLTNGPYMCICEYQWFIYESSLYKTTHWHNWNLGNNMNYLDHFKMAYLRYERLWMCVL